MNPSHDNTVFYLGQYDSTVEDGLLNLSQKRHLKITHDRPHFSGRLIFNKCVKVIYYGKKLSFQKMRLDHFLDFCVVKKNEPGP